MSHRNARAGVVAATTARQRGVALITAILVVALATVAAVSLAVHTQLDTRRTSNVLDNDQAYEYALGVETWARIILARDARDNRVDDLGEVWARRLPALPVTGGQVAGHITDLQGLFNLNNLVVSGKPSAPDVAQFQRLLAIVGLQPQLVQAVIDWIDPDVNVTFPDGAEDEAYLLLPTPYRAANQPLVSVSSLRLVKGFDAKAVAALEPYVCALPGHTTINVNTAPAPVLQSLADGLTQQDAKALVNARGQDGFASVQDFLKQDPLAGRKVDAQGLSVASHYFLVTSDARVGNGRVLMYSKVERADNGQTRVLMRTRGAR
ncbi:MAG: type II secretion system minor pseudopilin GspK [Gammaproteobacteria bacterium]